ncbi:MAG TPA: sigma-70 family RNA polymerase sigma factor [Desulfobacterales bacterium]|nr:sigma-70 family RNA polymerase sigma factor [Desulfobacterales bacterium]
MKKDKEGTAIKKPCNTCGSRKRCRDESRAVERGYNVDIGRGWARIYIPKTLLKPNCGVFHKWLNSDTPKKIIRDPDWVPRRELNIGLPKYSGMMTGERRTGVKQGSRAVYEDASPWMWSTPKTGRPDKEMWKLIDACITKKQHEVLFLIIIKRKSLTEAAGALGLNRQAAMDRITQAKKRIKKSGKLWKSCKIAFKHVADF